MNTRGVWRAGRVRNMLVETTYKGLHIWGKRSARRKKARENGNGRADGTSKDGNAVRDEHILVERKVPALVDEALWARAQETLRRNRLCRPDVVKRKYLLRGLMKCRTCGLSFVGTVSEGRLARNVPPGELATLEVRGDLVLRRYYLCNGKNASHQNYGKLGRRCPSGHVRAHELETRVWKDIEVFLRAPGQVVETLRQELQARHGGADTRRERLEHLKREKAAREEQKAALLRLFRRGAIGEGELDPQLAELRDEEAVLEAECVRLERELGLAGDADRALESAEVLLHQLRQKLDGDTGEGQDGNGQGGERQSGELSWETRRRIVEQLVAGIEVESHFDPSAPRGKQRTTRLHVTYAFDEPGANIEDGAEGGTRRRPHLSEASSPMLSLVRAHTLHSSPSPATDRSTLPGL